MNYNDFLDSKRITVAPSTSKPCARCGSTANGYTKDKRATDGLNSWCRLCTQVASKKWYQANAERRLEVAREWASKNKECVNRIARNWSAKNREKARKISCDSKKRNHAITIKWRSANRQRLRTYENRYRKKNPNHARVQRNNRRARIKKADGKHTTQDVLVLFEQQHGLCAGCCCDITCNYQVDHIIPLSRNGGNGVENLQLLCPPCNTKKGIKSQSEFLAMIHKAA